MIAPYASGAQQWARWFSLQDEIQFDPNGLPTNALPTGSGGINRPGTYTWAYVLRLQSTTDPLTNNTLVLTAIVVYADRNTDVPAAVGESSYSTTGTGSPGTNTAGANTVALTYPVGAPPNIRNGGWILDTTYTPTSGGMSSVAAQFYQVANVSDNGAGTVNLDLDKSLKNDVKSVVVMEKVIAVIDRVAPDLP
jgi:hypothetical protein